MIEISVMGLQKSFDLEKKILDGLTFQINSGERVGLLGKNGAGKTTLFRILTGEIDYDAGEVAIASDRRVGLISQIPVYPAGYTVDDVLQSAFERMRRMADEMERLSAQMANGDESEETLRRYGELSARFEGLGGYDTATAVNKVANGLSIPADMRTRLFDTLSGGEKTRVNLGRLILEDTDILLLDEPTNHLDLHAIEWLEEYLASFKGTVVAISHDRYFLDRTITRVIEILDGHAEFYNGNYSFYAVEKERRYLEKMRQYEKEQAKIRQLEAAADKLHLWAFMGNDALHKRAFSMEKRIERMRTTDKPTREKKMTAQFRSSEFLGDEVLTLSPYFSEYKLYAEAAGGTLTAVPSNPEDFQIDLDAFSAAISEKTAVVLLNSPNNPSGVILSRRSITKLAELLDIDLKNAGKPEMANLPDKLRAYGAEKAAAECGVGVPTLRDIAKELSKPGRDPRDELPAPILRTDVLDIKDLKPGMVLTGTVRNVIDFGVFVDIGVHQDGLVHISQVCNKFIKHPSEVVSVGDIVDVVVLDVDEKKKRISLSMKQAK